jgi:CheY-like chemotaxis protein
MAAGRWYSLALTHRNHAELLSVSIPSVVEEKMDTKKTIMVVDDNPDIITIVRTILEGKGYNVLSAYSGAELFTTLEKQKPDLIVLDIMMPQMDGLEVLTRLKGAPDTSAIPVILLTAKVQYEDVLGGYKLGADYYITKPFTSTQLINGINLLLGEVKS